jgi:hypothetical protein
LGFTSAGGDTRLLRRLDQAQVQLETGKTLPEFLLEYDTLIAVTAISTFDLPVDFNRLHEEYEAYYLDTEGTGRIRVPRRNYSEAWDSYGPVADEGEVEEEDATRPSVWVLRQSTGFMVPTPTEAFSLYLTYYKHDVLPSDLGADDTNLWLTHAPEALIGEAGVRAAAIARDSEAMQIFSGRRDAGVRALLGDIIERQLAGRSLIMGRNK